MKKNLPLKLDREILLQLSPEQLVDIIIEQAIATEKRLYRTWCAS
jgi:transposase